MSAIVKLHGIEAVFNDSTDKWGSENEAVAVLLNSLLEDPKGYSPNPAAVAALQAKEEFGAQIIKVDQLDLPPPGPGMAF